MVNTLVTTLSTPYSEYQREYTSDINRLNRIPRQNLKFEIETREAMMCHVRSKVSNISINISEERNIKQRFTDVKRQRKTLVHTVLYCQIVTRLFDVASVVAISCCCRVDTFPQSARVDPIAVAVLHVLSQRFAHLCRSQQLVPTHDKNG